MKNSTKILLFTIGQFLAQSLMQLFTKLAVESSPDEKSKEKTRQEEGENGFSA